jgi:hypothetical protein
MLLVTALLALPAGAAAAARPSWAADPAQSATTKHSRGHHRDSTSEKPRGSTANPTYHSATASGGTPRRAATAAPAGGPAGRAVTPSSGVSVVPAASGAAPEAPVNPAINGHARDADPNALDVSVQFDVNKIAMMNSAPATVHVNRQQTTTSVWTSFSLTAPEGSGLAFSGATPSCVPMYTPTLTSIAFTISLDVGQPGCDLHLKVSDRAQHDYTIGPDNIHGGPSITPVGSASTVTLVVPPTVELFGAFTPTTVDVGNASTLSLRLQTTDSSVGLDRLGYKVTLPTGLAADTGSSSSDCGGTLTVTGSSLALRNGTLGVGVESCTITVSVTVQQTGRYTLDSSTLSQLDWVTGTFTGSGAPTVDSRATQSITIEQPAETSVAGGPVTLVATASSGLPVSFSSTTPTVCEVTDATVTLLAAGACGIDADQGGNDSYQPAPTVNHTFTVTPAPVATLGPPRDVTAVAGVSSITVSWLPPAETGVHVTGYTAVAQPGPATCRTTAATTCVLGGVAGVSYTVTVVAHSVDGDSPGSVPSNAAVPSAPPVAAAPPAADAQLTTDKGLISTATPGQRLVVIGSGFAAYSTVTITIYSTPTVLANVRTDEGGDFSVSVTIPVGLDAGQHTFTAVGVDPDGAAHALKLAVTVPAVNAAVITAATAVPGGLAVTGSSVSVLVSTGLVLVATGTALRGARLRRRRHLPRTLPDGVGP